MNNQMVLDDKGKDNGETVYCLAGNGIDRADTAGCNGKGWTEDVSFALNTIDRPAVYDPSVHHGYRELGDISETVRSRYGTGGNNVPMVIEETPLSVSNGNGQLNQITMSDKANALDTMHDQQAIMYQAASYGSYAEGAGSPQASGGGSENLVVRQTNCVRRLTPLECERLQGYPDGWTDIPGATDSKRYKALGNSIALPFWEFLAKRFVSIGGVQTIGSLFDGIGGFPLCFYRAGAKTLWTSEIEDFPIRVVHERFDDNGDLKEGWK